MNKKTSVLIVDDEERLRALVSGFLEKQGYTALVAEDGSIAVDMVKRNPDIDLIIMDVMMPELDGWAACRQIREFSKVPVIMLTARSQEFDEIYGFESGADDYVTKPFSLSVLEKRICAVLSRSQSNTTGGETASGLKIDKDAYKVSLNGEDIELTLKEFEILVKLYDNKGRVFTRDQLLDSIWGYDFDKDARTIDSHMARLRTKLKEWGSTHLKTVYGLGYKLDY